MLPKLIATQNTFSFTLLRIAVGATMIPGGMEKLTKFGTTLDEFAKQHGIPTWLGCLAIAAESFGALGLIVGFLTRIAALGVACTMAGAIYWVHWANGFNWKGGWCPHLIVIAACLALMIGGAGALSIDRRIANR